MKGQWNAQFLVIGHVKPGPVGRSYGGISFAPCEELIVFAYQMWKPQFLSVVQSPFDNCHSPFSPTMFFEIGVYIYMGKCNLKWHCCLSHTNNNVDGDLKH